MIDFILKEWLLSGSCVGLLITSVFTKRFPSYTPQELEVLFILFVLFITVNGLQKSKIMVKIAESLENGKVIPLKLVLSTFLLSMTVTNDIALIVIVPLTLSLNINRKDIIVILEALAANAGSALTPFGNPQNLFIYWFYNVNPYLFMKEIAPFSILFFVLLIICSLLIKTKSGEHKTLIQKTDKKAYIYSVFFFIVLLAVFRVIPVLTGISVIIFAILFDRRALSVDYALLFTFLFFFGIADNLKIMFAHDISGSCNIFMFSVLASQIMSNVPATLLFAKFTSDWHSLLWGANAGGFGSLVGSLANLIAYKIYITHESKNNSVKFTVKFLIMGYSALFVSIGFYYILFQ